MAPDDHRQVLASLFGEGLLDSEASVSLDWAVAVFGWPGPILAIALSVAGVAYARASLLVLAAIAISPFSFYLLLTPRFGWGIVLPLVPLIAARAVSRDAEHFAWAAVVGLVAVLASIAART